MRAARRVLLAGITHETHTFVPGLTGLDCFRIRRADELLTVVGNGSTLAGAVETGQELGWEFLPAIHLSGPASAIVADDVIEAFWEALFTTLDHEPEQWIDGVYLDFHGAMVSETYHDVEGELLRRLRTLSSLAHVPIGGVLDLHGNISPAMAALSTCFVAYRHNPHTDAHAAAQQGAYLLDQVMGLRVPVVTVHAQVPLLLPPVATATTATPMVELEAAARAIEERHPEILAANVFAGFPYADTPHAGVSFTAVTAGDPQIAQAKLRSLVECAMAFRHCADPQGMTLTEALERALAHREGPVLLVEPADNIGGGAPGDLTIVLRGLLAAKVRGAGVIINDPYMAAVLQGWALHQCGTLQIGGVSGVVGAEPVTMEVELISRSDGHFTLEDRHSHQATSGIEVNMGPCAVVRGNGITLLLTSQKTAPFDLGQWRSQGIDPETFAIIAVKAAVAHHRAYGPIARASYTLNTIGPCAADLRTLPYQHVRRPIYPLDELI